MATVEVHDDGPVRVVTIARPERRNAVDAPTGRLLYEAFVEFEHNGASKVAVLTGAGGTFCSGADLKSVTGSGEGVGRLVAAAAAAAAAPGPRSAMGPAWLRLSKPTIAAVEGYAVAGGLELACWCDLRVVASDAVLGVFCRRWDVPLVDGGTVRLSRLIGESRALDMILTGRAVAASEALDMGLANRVVEPGGALRAAVGLARELAAFPQGALRSDRRSVYEQGGMPLDEALRNEARIGTEHLRTGDAAAGIARFAGGEGRHGAPGSGQASTDLPGGPD